VQPWNMAAVSLPPPCHKVCTRRNLPAGLLAQAAMASSSSFGEAPWPKWPPSAASRQRPGAHGWLLRQAERLQAVRDAGLARERPPPGVQSKAGAPPPPHADHRAVEGLRCAGFLPGRKVWYALGRPVCVAGLIKRASSCVRKAKGVAVSLPPRSAQCCAQVFVHAMAARCSR
jgi:hypothetical protein